ncbi:MAG: metallophosphoesterase family protein [Clostridia bacterium]|nr:metallophosphoesterase family protein [Clostridia bacterium]
MKLLILSDIHSNVTALEAVYRDAGPVDGIYCAGDYVDYGTDPHAAINWVRQHHVHCVIGNHDRHLLHILESGEVEAYKGTRKWKWVHDNCERMTEEDFAFLRSLPAHLSFTDAGIAYVMQHQMKDGSYEMPESTEAFDACWNVWYTGESGCSQRRMIFGHTHRRCVHQLDQDALWLNPGSVSYRRPDDHDKRAHYMLITDGILTFHAVAYPREAMYARVLEYVRRGDMLETDLQDLMFFFGPAATTRDPLPHLTEE